MWYMHVGKYTNNNQTLSMHTVLLIFSASSIMLWKFISVQSYNNDLNIAIHSQHLIGERGSLNPHFQERKNIYIYKYIYYIYQNLHDHVKVFTVSELKHIRKFKDRYTRTLREFDRDTKRL